MKKLIATTLLLLATTSTPFANTSNKADNSHLQYSSPIAWSNSPKIKYTNGDLKGQNRNIIIRVDVSTTGSITQANVVKSSGLISLDQLVHRAVMSARFKPYTENGIAVPFKAEQPFQLNLEKEKRPLWKKLFFIP